MNLKAEASRFILSYLWWIIEPLLFVLVFYLVFEVLLGRGRGDFLLFLVCGKVPFMWFQKSVVSSSNSIVQNRGLINQIDMPKAIFPYVSVHEALYRQWAVFLVLLAFLAFYGHWPTIGWLWILPIVFVQYLLILVCSLLGALCVSFVRDVKMLINMGMLFLLFASGIFWDVHDIASPQSRELLLTLNPMAYLLDAYRQVLMYDSFYDMSHLLALGFVCLTGLLILHWVMHVSGKAIAAKVVNS